MINCEMDYDIFYTVIPGYLNPKNPAFKKKQIWIVYDLLKAKAF